MNRAGIFNVESLNRAYGTTKTFLTSLTITTLQGAVNYTIPSGALNLMAKILPENEPREVIRTGGSLFDLLDSDWEGYDGLEEVEYEAGATYE